MACPSCGQKFHSDFKLAGTKQKGAAATIFALPGEILDQICRHFKS